MVHIDFLTFDKIRINTNIFYVINFEILFLKHYGKTILNKSGKRNIASEEKYNSKTNQFNSAWFQKIPTNRKDYLILFILRRN